MLGMTGVTFCVRAIDRGWAARLPRSLRYATRCTKIVRKKKPSRSGRDDKQEGDAAKIFCRGRGNTVGFPTMGTLLEARELRKSYSRATGLFFGNGSRRKASGPKSGPELQGDDAQSRFMAVDGVSFSVESGETFAVVGESGCGKTTLARMLLRLIEPDAGEIQFGGRSLLRLSGEELRQARRGMQMIFQDPFASLNPRMRVGEIVAEPLAIHERKLSKNQRMELAETMLRRVGLECNALKRYPHEFSGGQRQRIGIARALILRP